MDNLAVAVITANEAPRLGPCLASVAGLAREVVVVDSGSTDGTVELARSLGARLIHHEWQGFGRQKQFAVDQCRAPWVLLLDADERLTEEAAAEIRGLPAPPPHVAYSLPRQNYFCGAWLRHGGWWPDRVVRLFDRRRARISERPVHEAVITDGPVGQLQGAIVHLANRDLSHTLAKIDRYSTAGARMLLAAGQRGSLGRALAHGLWAFANDYLVRRGFLDRGPGFLQAVTNGVNVFFKYAKLWELQRQPPTPPQGDPGADPHRQDQRHR